MREAAIPIRPESGARGSPRGPSVSAGAVWWSTVALLTAALALPAAIRFPETSFLVFASISAVCGASAFAAGLARGRSTVNAPASIWFAASVAQASLVVFDVGSGWLHAADLPWRSPPAWLMASLLPTALGWLWIPASASGRAEGERGARSAAESLLPALLLTFAVMLAVPFPNWLALRASNSLWLVAGLNLAVAFAAAASFATVVAADIDRDTAGRLGLMIGSSLFAIGVAAATIGDLSGERSIASIAFVFFSGSSLAVLVSARLPEKTAGSWTGPAEDRWGARSDPRVSESGSGRLVDLALPGALVAVALTVAALDRTRTPNKERMLEWLAIGSLVALFIRQISTMLRLGDALSRLRSGQAELSRRADIDMLTGLPNRGSLSRRLAEELERAGRYQQPLSLVFVDVDRFKAINDRLGHGVGDDVLARVAAILRSSARTIDFVGRYGGEEFLIVAPGTWTEDAVILAERIRAAVASDRFGEHDGKLAVTVSVGIAGYPEHAPDLQSLMERADAALYASKRLGRNRVSVADVEPPTATT